MYHGHIVGSSQVQGGSAHQVAFLYLSLSRLENHDWGAVLAQTGPTVSLIV